MPPGVRNLVYPSTRMSLFGAGRSSGSVDADPVSVPVAGTEGLPVAGRGVGLPLWLPRLPIPDCAALVWRRPTGHAAMRETSSLR